MDNNERKDLKALMDMFTVIKKLSKYYTVDQAIDVLDIYFKTNDASCLTKEDNIRDYVVNSQMREIIYPSIDGNYKHLSDYIDAICSSSIKKK